MTTGHLMIMVKVIEELEWPSVTVSQRLSAGHIVQIVMLTFSSHPTARQQGLTFLEQVATTNRKSESVGRAVAASLPEV